MANLARGLRESQGRFVSVGEAAKMLGVSRTTIRNYCRSSNELVWRRTIGGHRRIAVASLNGYLGLEDETENSGLTVTYSRVSTTFQRRAGALDRQKERLLEYCESELGCNVDEVLCIVDCGSGLSEERRGFLLLIDLILAGDVERLVVEHIDRLSRNFGNLLRDRIIARNGTELIVTNSMKKEAVTEEQELAFDIVSIVTVYGARIHGKRGGMVNKLAISEESKNRILELHKLGFAQTEILKRIQSEGHKCERTGRKLTIHAIRLVLLEQEKLRAVFEEKTTTNPLEQFINENCIRAEGLKCFTRPFHREYANWITSQGQGSEPPTPKATTRRVKELGYETARTGSGYTYFVGFKLKDNERASRSHLG
ncbi:MAG: hypothetical protein CMJ48_00975 [Planctomycetaceae bacterium]|nr:hypothetical protein [Planctomycetaceae bacterium]